MGRTISQAQLHFLKGNDIDLMGEDKGKFQAFKLKDIADTLTYLGALYAKKLSDNLTKADASSSGALADSIIPLDVSILGSVYTVQIQALHYAKFIDEGVDGWAKSRGSKYKFKTKGVDPKGEMVKSIKAYLMREGSFSRNVSTQLTKREVKQKSIIDTSTRAAMSVAYMIKRQGIKPTRFWTKSTNEMRRVVEVELGKALKTDIINSIVQ